jgi:hypothetical protein
MDVRRNAVSGGQPVVIRHVVRGAPRDVADGGVPRGRGRDGLGGRDDAPIVPAWLVNLAASAGG